MKPEPPLMGPMALLNWTRNPVDHVLAIVHHPRHPEDDDPLGFHYPFRSFVLI